MVQRFRREVQAMAQISHPNVLQVFDYDSITVKKCDQEARIEYIRHGIYSRRVPAGHYVGGRILPG